MTDEANVVIPDVNCNPCRLAAEDEEVVPGDVEDHLVSGASECKVSRSGTCTGASPSNQSRIKPQHSPRLFTKRFPSEAFAPPFTAVMREPYPLSRSRS